MHQKYIDYFQSHIDYIKRGRVKFILYDSGSGGEFLSLRIAKYSSDNYFKTPYIRNSKNRYLSPYNLLGNFFYMGRTFSDIVDYDDPNGYYFGLLDYRLSYHGNMEEYLNYLTELDEHFSNDGQYLSRTLHFTPHFMTPDNCYYLHPDTDEMESYRMKLWEKKVPSFDPDKPLKDFKKDLYKKSVENNYNIIQMSKMFEKGYLEDIFNIPGNDFHEDLMTWHERNLLLISSD